MKNNFFSKLHNLETVEEKSFWILAPVITIIGALSFATEGLYDSNIPMIVAAILCLIVPLSLMILVSRTKNYHFAYPLLCISVGTITIPITFILNGGFFSGMPLFCLAATIICAFCYVKKWRYISLISCFFGNSIAFFYVINNGSSYVLDSDSAIIKDIIFSYFAASLALFIAISFIIVEIRNYRINQEALQKYFDIEVRREILEKALNGTLNDAGEKKKAVILFADVSRFTTTSEKMEPNVAAQFLNEFFSIAEKNIHDSNGIIDKFIGDCIMAYWFDEDGRNGVYNAVKAVENMKVDLYAQSEKIFEKYGTELNFSAGISYGDIIFGNIGSENRHEYTIIGDAVNTASRIESVASGGEILLSDSAATMIADKVRLESIATNMYLKGKNKSVNLYRVIDLNSDVSKNQIDHINPSYKLYVCGSRGSFPISGLRFSDYGGETSCYIIRKNDYALIIDCGTGLKNADYILNGCKKIDILLTHVHYDHILGLLMSRPPENVPIRLFGNFSAWSPNAKTLVNFMEHPYWPIGIDKLENVDVELEKEIDLEENIKATFYRSDHPDQGCVIKIMCGDKKVCIFADCEDPNKLDSAIGENSDILLYDGMYDENDTIDHTGWGHGTWQSGVKYAIKHHIKHLVITHHNPELGDHTLLERETKARTLLNNVSFAKSGDCIDI